MSHSSPSAERSADSLPWPAIPGADPSREALKDPCDLHDRKRGRYDNPPWCKASGTTAPSNGAMSPVRSQIVTSNSK
jgi:hypothetical protein